jgi:hypothetical protein
VFICCVEEYTWEALYQLKTTLPGKIYEHSAVVYNRAMWIAGGLEVFTPRNDVWKWEFGEFCVDILSYGASLAKWLAHFMPFTSKVAGSNLSENFPNATRTQSSCEKSKSQRSAESRGFSLGTPVFSHRES